MFPPLRLGLAHVVNGTAASATNVGGSFRFMAPELLPTILDDDTQSTKPTLASDMGSLGCIISEGLTSKKPYHTRPSHSQVVFPIVNGIHSYTEANFINDYTENGISGCKDIWQILKKCWEMDPAFRPTIVDFEGLAPNLFGPR
ncbi:hypothetical protein JAAARDRAFT_524813 [Jaapia argillacea MUCL 33604]|uniref:Protein kinase domain-containing protein n=1 Tax=Jaapia argillacea MUCL 33604 TaxID=933084 RepID=A0A067Q4D9_9AGAM|nr:hypothetical protein JAAARDRAFT_524813 [Jaapia argillacea MUCL 33604]